MFHITIIAIDTLKEPFWREAYQAYSQRLAPYAKLTVTELPPEKPRGNVDDETIRARESERLYDAAVASKAQTIVCLTEHGQTFTSLGFAQWLQGNEQHGTIAFIIGGARGVDQSLTAKADLRLSLSPMTFLHEMARVALVEQLYRACTINAGKAYHY